MRSDMAKLLTEAERYGSSDPSQKWGKRLRYDPESDYEDEPRRASMSRHGKSLSDVLNPLKGYIHKSVGRPWDDVYSEICANLDRRSVSGLHVFQHLWDYVSRNCWIGAKTGKVYSNERGWHGMEVDGYYVHPFTGILCEYRLPSRRVLRKARQAKPITEIRISDTERYQQFDGIWYYFENYEVVHEGKTLIAPHYLRETEPRLEVEVDGEIKTFYTVQWTEHFNTKRQLNSRELKKLGLRNQVKPGKPPSRRDRNRWQVRHKG